MAKRVRWEAKQLRRKMSAELGRDVRLEEVAEKTGISLGTLSRIENNKSRGVEFETLEKLAEFYGVDSVASLLHIEDQIRRSGLALASAPG